MGYSKRAYLIEDKDNPKDPLRSWLLEQDVVEARKSWVAVPENKLEDDEDYLYLDGKYYEVIER